MTEEIRNQLSKLAGFDRPSRTATERYQDGNAGRLASELSAAHVIEGSVALDRDRVRIGVAVIDAEPTRRSGPSSSTAHSATRLNCRAILRCRLRKP